jgi:hypothetical protein
VKGWYRGVMRDSLMGIPRKTVVIVAESSIEHTSINKTWWIISPELKKMYQVADTVAGSDCKQLVRIERPAKDQELCASLAAKLCKDSQYGPNRRHEIEALLTRR